MNIDYTDPDVFFEQQVFNILISANKPLQLDSLARIVKLPKKGKKQLEQALQSLVQQGKVIKARGAYAPASTLKTAEGVLSVQKAGMGFVVQSTLQGKDIYIHPTNMGDALHGDTVSVVVLPSKKGVNREGKIVGVVQRNLAEIPVVAVRRQKNDMWYCTPTNPRIHAMFSVEADHLTEKVKPEDMLLIKPLTMLHAGLWQAKATANLSNDQSPKAQEQLGKSNNGVPSAFPPEVLLSTQSLPENPSEQEFADRVDLRDFCFVTIDGKTAKDFDDAICVLPHKTSSGNNGFRLMVAIADVANYVTYGSALDKEALFRGNSYYFPLSVEPMLPEKLSNGLCSLRPMVPRLCMVADMQYSEQGIFSSATFYSAVIQSKARLTYGQIQRAIIEKNETDRAQVTHVLPMLEDAFTLAKAMHKERAKRGSLDFNIPEPQISIGEDGKIQKIIPQERHFGHKLIEEFMIAANEAVARFLEQKNMPFLFRSHPAPSAEKITNLLRFLAKHTQFTTVSKLMPKGSKQLQQIPTTSDLQRILTEAENTPNAYAISRLVLRSMMQAKYTTTNEGHYGLGSTSYCHFTSPIRRYADLLVHRALKFALGETPEKPISQAKLESIADQINATERTAVEAEREVHKRLTILYLQDKVGETYTGVISGITDFGIFVEMTEVMSEGMIRLANLGNDYYEYNQERQELRGKRTNTVFFMGQEVEVTIQQVSLAHQEITLALTSLPLADASLPPRRGGAIRNGKRPVAVKTAKNRSTTKKKVEKKKKRTEKKRSQ